MDCKRLLQMVYAGCLLLSFLMMNGDAGAAADKKDGGRQVPDVLVAFDAGEAGYAIVVEKQNQRLFLYDLGANFRRILSFNCSTGEVAGSKSRSGDKKTPEGVYFFTQMHRKRDLAPIYGSRAFPMDYPNLLDRIAGRDGNSIWMHGTNKPLKPRDSNGCVALNNVDIDRLAKYITLNRTPIIVVDTLSYLPVASAQQSGRSALDFLSRWAASIEKGTYHDYLKHYDADYVPDIAWWPDWSNIRKKTADTDRAVSLELKNRMVFKNDDIFVALVDQVVTLSGKSAYAGTRKLFFVEKNDRYRIVGDVYQAVPEKRKSVSSRNPLIAVAQTLLVPPKTIVARQEKKSPDPDRQIPDMIDAWLRAWSAKDIQTYGSYYSRSFRSQGGASLDAWLDYKRRLNRKYKYIRVTKRNLSVKQGKTQSVATFVQDYRSNRLNTLGTKKLILVRENGRWKIFRESWKKN